MDKYKLFSIIRVIISTENISEEDELVGDLGFSSFQIILLLSRIEQECFVDLPFCCITNTTTVSDLLSLIEREVEGND